MEKRLDKKIQIYGDSILRGVTWDQDAGRYMTLPENSVALFRKEFGGEIENQSRFGCTVQRGSLLLERALEQGMDCDVVVLEYGGNDCNFNWKEISEAPAVSHDPVTSPSLFEQLWRKMIRALKSQGIVPVIMSMTPLDSDRYLSWITRTGLSRAAILEWLGDTNRIYRFQEMYAGILERIAWETATAYINVRHAFLEERKFSELFCIDGIHPAKAGHALIKRCFGEFFRNYVPPVVRLKAI